MKRFLRVLLIFVTIGFLAFRIIHQMDHNSLYSRQINIALAVLAFFVSMGVLLVDQKQFVKNRSWFSFLPSIVGLFLVIIISVCMFSLYKRDRSPSVLYATGEVNTFVGLSIDFRKDMTYKISSWGLGADFYRGKYTMETDSTITIDRVIADKGVNSKHFLVRTSKLQNRNNKVIKEIFQLNDRGEINPDDLVFKVINKK